MPILTQLHQGEVHVAVRHWRPRKKRGDLGCLLEILLFDPAQEGGDVVL
jgi:hypothetical protein